MNVPVILLLATLFALGAARPHWGLSLVAALLPLSTVLPSSLAMGSSILASPVAVAGAAAAAGGAVRLFRDGRLAPHLIFGDQIRLLSLLFIVWVLLTHPAAAWSGEGDRNWVATFVQLWLLLVIAGAALASPEQQRFLMLAFGVACVLSAHVAIVGGGIGEDRALRSAGFALGVNAAARYFVVGTVFWLFLATHAKQGWFKAAGLLAAAYVMLGVLVTQSRSGIILAATAVILLPLVAARRRLTAIVVSLAALTVLSVTLAPAGTFDAIPRWFAPEESALSGDLDSVENNIRYYIWQAGVEMWRENPVAGIGIGRFSSEAPFYLRVGTRPATAVNAHSMFIRVLAETGLVGLALLCVVIVVCLRRAWRAPDGSEGGAADLSSAWFVVMVVLLVGAAFKDDTIEKLLWLSMGVASSYGVGVVKPRPAARRAVSPVPARRGPFRTEPGVFRRAGGRPGPVARPRS